MRVIEYQVPDREGDGKDERHPLVTTITDFRDAPADVSRGPTTKDGSTRPGTPSSRPACAGRAGAAVESPDMVRQEIWGYLLTHYAISALICAAATAAGIDPDRVKFKGPSGSSAAGSLTRPFPLSTPSTSWPGSWPASQGPPPEPAPRPAYPRVVKRARHGHYRVKRPGHNSIRHDARATIKLANPILTSAKVRTAA